MTVAKGLKLWSETLKDLDHRNFVWSLGSDIPLTEALYLP